ncbi:MAG: hypothetical protein WBD50_04920 [Candidatus Rhabdochlamydia sp.]
MLCSILIKVSEVLSKARTESNLASIKAGFSSADETAKAGIFQLGGGAILAGTGVAQGVAGCKSAAELAEATELRNNRIAYVQDNMKSEDLPAEDPEITVEVEALDEPITGSDKIEEELPIESVNSPTEEILGDEPILDEIEEEIFYDAQEEIQSCKQTKPEEQTEEAQAAENVEDQKKSSQATKEKDRLIRKANKEYDVEAALIQSKAGKLQGLAAPGQALYYVSLGLGDMKKSEAGKDTIEQQTREGTQAQQEKTTDGVNKEIDRLKDFDAFRSNSSSLKG